MYETVHPNLVLVLLFVRTEVERGEGLLYSCFPFPKSYFPFFQVIGSGQCETDACADTPLDDDSGLGNDNDWQIRPVAVDTTGSEMCCIKNISEFKRTRAIFPVVKIK